MFLTLLTGFILSACSCDDIVMDNVQEQKDVQRTQYIQTSYEKAYAKMLALYPSTFATGKRMSAGMPIVDNSYPLWYSDTALVTPDPNPNGPDQPGGGDGPTAANDSIYAYVFDFANEQGSMVVSVDENLPDLLVYTKGRNFLKNPFVRFNYTSENEVWETIFEEFQRLFEKKEDLIRSQLANFAASMIYEAEIAKADIEKIYEAEQGDGTWSGLNFKEIEVIRDWYTSEPGQYVPDGMIPIHWFNKPPFTSKIEQIYGSNAQCWDIIPTISMYLATLRGEVQAEDGWIMDRDLVLDPNAQADSAQIIDNISRLYYELGRPENLAVNYFQNQTMEVRNRVSGLLEKYKVSNVGVYESEHPLWAIWDEIDNGRPAICFVRGLTQSKNDQEVLSFLIDDYEVRDQSLLNTIITRI